MSTKRPPIPALRYADAPAAIDFLDHAFGIAPRAVYTDPQDPKIIVHAQLEAGSGMIMLGSARSGEAESLFSWKTAREAGAATMCVCIVVADPDAHHARAGAEGRGGHKGPL
jgi:uncharacterized glyoxalase superfamily protein PhnB